MRNIFGMNPMHQQERLPHGPGAVYLAEDSVLGRRVALKVPLFDEEDGGHALERFSPEAPE